MSVIAQLADRPWRWTLIATVALGALYLLIDRQRLALRAEMATGYGARMACSCVYIEGRDLSSCKSDFAGQAGMGLVRLADDPATRTVHASIPLIASRAARFSPGFGCLPDAP